MSEETKRISRKTHVAAGLTFGFGVCMIGLCYLVIGMPEHVLQALIYSVVTGMSLCLASPFILQPKFIPKDYCELRKDDSYQEAVGFTVAAILAIPILFLLGVITPFGVQCLCGVIAYGWTIKAEKWVFHTSHILYREKLKAA